MDRTKRTIAVAVADAALLILGIVGVATIGGGGNGPAAADLATSSASSTTTAALVTEPPTTAATAPAATTKGGKPAKPSPGATPAAGGAAEAPKDGQASPPRDGTYTTRYRIESPDLPPTAKSDGETKATFRTVRRTPAETEVEVKSSGSQNGPGSGSGSQLWRPEGVYQRYDSSNEGASCTPAEQLAIRLPLAAGVTWPTKADCTFTSGQGSGKVRSEGTSKVVGKKTAQVGGKTVEVWEILTTGTSRSEFSYQGRTQTVDGDSTETRLFAPAAGLTVHSETKTRSKASGRDSTSTVTTDLVSTDPS